MNSKESCFDNLHGALDEFRNAVAAGDIGLARALIVDIWYGFIYLQQHQRVDGPREPIIREAAGAYTPGPV